MPALKVINGLIAAMAEDYVQTMESVGSKQEGWECRSRGKSYVFLAMWEVLDNERQAQANARLQLVVSWELPHSVAGFARPAAQSKNCGAGISFGRCGGCQCASSTNQGSAGRGLSLKRSTRTSQDISCKFDDRVLCVLRLTSSTTTPAPKYREQSCRPRRLRPRSLEGGADQFLITRKRPRSGIPPRMRSSPER